MFMGFLKVCAIVISVLIIKYRQRIGDFLGEAAWMHYIGGVYNLVTIIGVFIFFWSVASLTGTTKIFFAPLYWLLGGAFI
jgi:hypothetical protein